MPLIAFLLARLDSKNFNEIEGFMKESDARSRPPARRRRSRATRIAVVVAASTVATVALSAAMAAASTVATVALSAAMAAASTGATRSASTARVSRTSVGQPDIAQAVVNTVAEDVESTAGRDHLSGLAGVEVSPARPASVTVYWHGAVPASLSKFATTDAAAMVRTLTVAGGLAVHFQSAPYTQAQLISLQAAVNNSSGFASSGISSMGFYPQATGLFVKVDNQADLAKARSLPALAHATIAVQYAVSPVTQLSLPGRYKDTPPFLGGIFLDTRYATISYQCSTGFGMHYANKKGAPYFVTTAAHCAAQDDLAKQKFWVWGNRKNVGVSFYFQADDDTVSLHAATPYGVKGAGGGARIYVGNTSKTGVQGQSTAPVAGAASVVSGDLVNTSGAFSGERTSISVLTTEMEWTAETPDGFVYRVFGAEAIKKNHSNAAGQGDSGGPVYFFYNGKNDKNGVRAAGIISIGFGSHYAVCTGLQDRKCFWDIGFPLMTGASTSIEREMNLTVNTTS